MLPLMIRALTVATLLAATSMGLWQPANDLNYSLNRHIPAKGEMFLGWYEQDDGQRAADIQAAFARGTTPVIVVNSCRKAADGKPITLADIAAGKFDGYETAFGKNTAINDVPVVITFDHEMNGSWPCFGMQPTAYIAAWDEYTNTVDAGCAAQLGQSSCPLITWMFGPNIASTGVDNPAPYLPDQNVGLVGIDGYFRHPSWTFASTFHVTISDIQAVTSAPIFIAETGVLRYSNPSRFRQIRQLCRSGYSFLYFDAEGANGMDWSLGPLEREELLRCLAGA